MVNENVIEWVVGDTDATLTLAARSKIANRILKLDEEYNIISVKNKDGSILAKVPINWVKIVPPRKIDEKLREKRRKHCEEIRKKIKDK